MSESSARKLKQNDSTATTMLSFVNIIYDDEFVAIINSLSKTIKDYYRLTRKSTDDLFLYSKAMSNYAIFAKTIANEMNTAKSLAKITQLSENIDSILNSKTTLDSKILSFNENLSHFFSVAKMLFKKMKTTRNNKLEEVAGQAMNNRSRQRDRAIKFEKTHSTRYASLNNSYSEREENLRPNVIRKNESNFETKSRSLDKKVPIPKPNVSKSEREKADGDIAVMTLEFLSETVSLQESIVKKTDDVKGKKKRFEKLKIELKKKAESILRGNFQKCSSSSNMPKYYAIDFAMNDLERKEKLISKLKKEMKEKEEAMNNLKKENEELVEKCKKLETDGAFKKELISFKNEFDILNMNSQRNITGFDETKKMLAQMRNDLNNLVKKDKTDKDKDKDKIKALEDQLIGKEAVINKLQETVSELQLANEKKANNSIRTNLAITQKTKEISELNESNKTLKLKVENLTHDISVLEQSNKTISELNSKLNAQLCSKVKEKSKDENEEKYLKQIDELETKIIILENRNKEVATVKEKNARLEKTIADLKSEIKKTLESSKKKKEDLSSELRNEKDAIKKELEMKSKQNEKLNKQIQELKSQLQENSQTILENSKKITHYETQIKNLKETLSLSSEGNLEAKAKEMIQLEEKIKAMTESDKEGKNAVSELLKRLENEKQLNTELLDKLQKANDENELSKKVKSSLASDVNTLNNKISSQEKAIQSLNAKISELNEANAKLKLENETQCEKQTTELSIVQSEYQSAKKEIEKLKERLVKENPEEITPELYKILTRRTYNNLSWFLVTAKSVSIQSYDNCNWIPKYLITNLEKFNTFKTEEDEQNEIIKNFIAKIESKDEANDELKREKEKNEKEIKKLKEDNNSLTLAIQKQKEISVTEAPGKSRKVVTEEDEAKNHNSHRSASDVSSMRREQSEKEQIKQKIEYLKDENQKFAEQLQYIKTLYKESEQKNKNLTTELGELLPIIKVDSSNKEIIRNICIILDVSEEKTAKILHEKKGLLGFLK